MTDAMTIDEYISSLTPEERARVEVQRPAVRAWLEAVLRGEEYFEICDITDAAMAAINTDDPSLLARALSGHD